jgi:hypothetical protein
VGGGAAAAVPWLIARRASDSTGVLSVTQFDPIPDAAPADGVHDDVYLTMFQSKIVNTKIRMIFNVTETGSVQSLRDLRDCCGNNMRLSSSAVQRHNILNMTSHNE